MIQCMHWYTCLYVYMNICIHMLLKKIYIYICVWVHHSRKGRWVHLSVSLVFVFISLVCLFVRFFGKAWVGGGLTRPFPNKSEKQKKKKRKKVDSPLLKKMLDLCMYGHISIYIYICRYEHTQLYAFNLLFLFVSVGVRKEARHA